MNIKDIDSCKPVRVILSGGGTAGHIYPAVALAERLRAYYGDDIDILFVGANGKMEMDKIPKLGYNIIGLPISGLVRKFTFKNLLLPFKIIISFYLSRRIIKKMKPNIVFGFGGYASAPIIKAAQSNKVATMIWEGNSYPGMANKVLSKYVQRVFVAYDNMDKFFNKEKLVYSGNPLRGDLRYLTCKLPEAYDYFGFDNSKQILLITGGSLGTRVFNEGVMAYFDKIVEQNKFNIIWQTGKYYYDEIKERIGAREHNNIWISPFIDRMDYAYGIADLTIARAGASTISELSLVGMASIIVPSPNVADDHQRKNAMSLANKNAAVMMEDRDAVLELLPMAEKLLLDSAQLSKLRISINHFSKGDAVDIIFNEMKKFIIL